MVFLKKLRKLRNVNIHHVCMKELNNPFVIYGYKGADYFCDRVDETQRMIAALYNERNVTLIAQRRMGKTGLILHAFDKIAKSQPTARCFYIDIFSTKNLGQMVQLFARTILGRLDTNTQGAMRKITEFFGSWRPVISFDQLTGLPSVSLDIKPTEATKTLKQIFEYMQLSGKRCYVAIDEFQQILNYSDQGIEAELRSYIQFLPNVYFVFSGSMQHIMEEMFTSANRPFFQSSQIMHLNSVDRTEYREFANRFFRKQHRAISEECFAYLYNKVDGITWYVQSILNRAYQYDNETIDTTLVDRLIRELTDEQESVFQSFYASLTELQALLLQAIAKEECVYSPFAHEFISKYRLRAVSSVRTALKALTDKQLVYHKPEGYIVYDRFFGLWLKEKA